MHPNRRLALNPHLQRKPRRGSFMDQSSSQWPHDRTGHFNDRYKDWDSNTNPRGTAFRCWFDRLVWTLHASNTLTYTTEQGCSTIDIALTKNLEISKRYVYRGNWDGASDHSPVVISTLLRREEKHLMRFTPISVRRDPDAAKSAAEAYKRTTPLALKSLNQKKTDPST